MGDQDPASHIAAYFQAVRANDVDQVRAILSAQPGLVDERIVDVWAEYWERADAADRRSNTALHWTANPGNREQSYAALTQALIEYGADVDAMGYNGKKGVAPVVVFAAWEGELEVLRLLLENGADPNKPGAAESALYTAVEHTPPDAPEPNKVSVLLEFGAQHDIFTAAMCGRADLVREQLDEYPELIERRCLKRNRTPLEEAAYYGRGKVAELLIVRSATVSIHTAAALGLTDRLAGILEEGPQQLTAQDDSRETLLLASGDGRTVAGQGRGPK